MVLIVSADHSREARVGTPQCVQGRTTLRPPEEPEEERSLSPESQLQFNRQGAAAEPGAPAHGPQDAALGRENELDAVLSIANSILRSCREQRDVDPSRIAEMRRLRSRS
jgi:hypothetical protein